MAITPPPLPPPCVRYLLQYQSAKGCLGGVAGSLTNLLFITRGWIPGLEEQDALFKQTIQRWGLAVYGLTWIAAAGKKTMEEAAEEMVIREILTRDEARAVYVGDTDNT